MILIWVGSLASLGFGRSQVCHGLPQCYNTQKMAQLLFSLQYHKNKFERHKKHPGLKVGIKLQQNHTRKTSRFLDILLRVIVQKNPTFKLYIRRHFPVQILMKYGKLQIHMTIFTFWRRNEP